MGEMAKEVRIMTAARMAAEMLLMVMVGIAVGKLGIVKEDFSAQLTGLVTDICLPCLILYSFWTDFSFDDLVNCRTLLLLSVLELILGFLAGAVFIKLFHNSESGRVMRLGCMFTNFTFIGIPLMESLFGESILLYCMIFLLPVRLGLYSLPQLLLLSPERRAQMTHRPFSQLAREFLSPPIAALLLGILMYLSGWRFPAIISDVVAMLKSLCAPLGMLLCGISLAPLHFREIFRPSCIPFTLVRTLLLPVFLFLTCISFGITGSVRATAVFCVACPCASLVVPLTIRYGSEPSSQHIAGSCVFLSTLLSVATIPLWDALLNYF